MKTDIQIAQEAEMKHIREVAEGAGIAEDELEFYGKYKAKLLMNSGNGSRTARTESWFLLQPLIRPRRERERRQFL